MIDTDSPSLNYMNYWPVESRLIEMSRILHTFWPVNKKKVEQKMSGMLPLWEGSSLPANPQSQTQVENLYALRHPGKGKDNMIVPEAVAPPA